jgi:molybdopterin-containing oxidoreductase family membrane subunit
MSTLEPDQSIAARLTGLEPGAQPPARRPKTVGATRDDGTLIEDPGQRAPLVLGDRSFGEVTDIVCGYAEAPMPKPWLALFTIFSTVAALGTGMILYLIITGVGVWGLNNQVDWAWDITNFVFWIGIGHAGTLISAILCLLKQNWRTAVNRSAEAMTIFAVVCAGIFPGVHVGRVWFAWMLFPIPNSNAIWPNFRSPLLWDVFAVSTYATVSALFWYMGMIPDLATLRDRAYLRLSRGLSRPFAIPMPVGNDIVVPFLPRPDTIRAMVYGLLSVGWRFSSRHWHRYEKAYLMLAGISTPLVLSVHSIVSFDFATSVLPGWHTTIFPPYFVAGAVFGGFAMVLLLLIPIRAILPNFSDLLTLRHLENMAKILLVTGTMVGFAYSMEFFIAWYGGNRFEFEAFANNRVNPNVAPYWWAYWTMITCNVVFPQLFWVRRFRQSPVAIWIVALAVTIGMWFERFVIIVTSLHRAFIPGEWGMFFPTWVDILTFVGSCGIFLTLFMLFLKFLPVFALAEVKVVMPQAHPHDHHEED